MKIEYVRSQFTRYDEEIRPNITFDNSYLDFEEVSSGLSKQVCSYGYQKRTYNSHGGYKTEWVTREELEEYVLSKEK